METPKTKSKFGIKNSESFNFSLFKLNSIIILVALNENNKTKKKYYQPVEFPNIK